MKGMKISVSLSDADVSFLDGYATEAALGSRSAALQRAVAVLRAEQLSSAYEAAYDEWAESADCEAWEPVSADGLPER